MPNYQETKIYKIYSLNDPSIVYYGATTKKYLYQRLQKHRHQYKGYKAGTSNDCGSHRILEKDIDAIIELVELYPCNSKKEQSIRERYYIENNKCVNMVIPGRSPEEYNKTPKMKTWYKEYRKTEKYKNKKSEYYKNNYETLRSNQKEYYQNKKEAIKNQKRELVICECGVHTDRGHISRHRKTQKHVKKLKQINEFKEEHQRILKINEELDRQYYERILIKPL